MDYSTQQAFVMVMIVEAPCMLWESKAWHREAPGAQQSEVRIDYAKLGELHGDLMAAREGGDEGEWDVGVWHGKNSCGRRSRGRW